MELRPESGFAKTLFSLGLLRQLFKNFGLLSLSPPRAGQGLQMDVFLIKLVIETGPDPPWGGRGLEMVVF